MSSPPPNPNDRKRTIDQMIDNTRARDAALNSMVNSLRAYQQILGIMEDNDALLERATKRHKTQQQTQEERWMCFLIGFSVCLAMIHQARSSRSQQQQQGPKSV